MAETGRPEPPAPAGGPTREQLEERWKEVIGTLGERPRDAELLVKAGQISEQLNRSPEAYTYYHKALTLDPSKAFLVPKLKLLAVSPEQKDEVTKMSRRPTSFSASLNDIFKYPVRGKGLPVLILGAIFLWIARGLIAHGIGGAGMTIAGFAAAYMTLFYIDVCHTTVGGDDHLPDWPDPLRINEFAYDVLKFVCAMVAAFLPVIVILIVCGSSLFSSAEEDFPMPTHLQGPVTQTPVHDPDDDDAVRPAPAPAPARPAPPPPAAPSFPLTLILAIVGIAVFGLFGLVYLPMAKLANVVMGSPWACFNYPFIAQSILATSKNYAICLACYFGISLVVGVAEVAVKLANVIVFTGCLLAFLELYGMTVLMRLLGLFYRMTQAKLGWMTD